MSDVTTEKVGVKDEVVEIAQTLVKFDTTNTGKPETTKGEIEAAEYSAELLREAGLEVEIIESAPGRANVVARWRGEDSSQPGLIVHGHLDVVPAEAADWSTDPFSGEIRDGYLCGRGAVDMKGQVATLLATIRQWAREGRRPPRDMVICLLADEEAGGKYGAKYLVKNRPELFAGCSEVVGLEVGGFSFTLPKPSGKRVYLYQCAEKGTASIQLYATGTAGHGSQVNPDNSIDKLAQAIVDLRKHAWPVVFTKSMRYTLRRIADELGIEFDERNPDVLIEQLGPISKWLKPSIRDTVNPTIIKAGYKGNVVPGTAWLRLDGRFMWRRRAQFLHTLGQIVGSNAQIKARTSPALQDSFAGRLPEAITEALLEQDPDALVLPWFNPAATDAKAFKKLRLPCYGFGPLQLPDDLDFAGLFHGNDERVPLDALRFGVRALSGFFQRCAVTQKGMRSPLIGHSPTATPRTRLGRVSRL